ncbi:xylose isomerase [Paraburkholderia xenovorans LB400]|uniref:Xylene monooxygenase electron transfer component n=1 Tax=Paraburkholderia xenovorans (strain LB400) TaxID=266265 RepID=Q143R0_PARXL|nr:2Fe-2S iron-sulfur cluster-binding protein [Paraburkholderia xenovorans]ABE29429.1 xylene monooxygenase electron transfer component [Paraburkholderia xenovorans LB400]AIP29862.1 xylose isomerase [Paraburkholderia xenovorans LB400]
MRDFLKSAFGRSKPKQLRILPQDVTIEIGQGQTLLEAALANGIAYPHDCTVGTCASCKTRLKQGRVREATPFGYTLSKDELDAGYILACQAFPKDELTVVEIDSSAGDLMPAEKYTANIIATEPLTHDILRVTVQTDRAVSYAAGQYANLRKAGGGRARSYSFANAPQRKGRTLLEFYIRKVPGGEFTESLFGGELKGVSLEMEAPLGTFHLRAGDSHMVCIAGGSGLAPLVSILEHARGNRIKRDCTLLFGARTQADLYQLDAIGSIASNWQGDFRFIPVLSDEPLDSDWKGARGLVTDHIAPGFCEGGEGYLCGPPLMIDAAIASLAKHGIPLEKVFYDKFTDSRDR